MWHQSEAHPSLPRRPVSERTKHVLCTAACIACFALVIWIMAGRPLS